MTASTTVPSIHRIEIANVVRELPVHKTGSGASIAILDLLGDPSLTEAAASELAKLMPTEAEIILSPYGKGIAMIHSLQLETGLPAVVARKNKAFYLREPVLAAKAVSITTQEPHFFYLCADKADLLRGKRVVIVDDVVSGRGTLTALEELAKDAGATVIAVMAIATEGTERPDVTALLHLPVFPA